MDRRVQKATQTLVLAFCCWSLAGCAIASGAATDDLDITSVESCAADSEEPTFQATGFGKPAVEDSLDAKVKFNLKAAATELEALLRDAEAAVAKLQSAVERHKVLLNSWKLQAEPTVGTDVRLHTLPTTTEGNSDPNPAVALALSPPPGRNTLLRYRAAWPDYFRLLSVVVADAEATCVHLLPATGPCRFVVVGDAAGKLLFFTPQGDLQWELDTGTRSPIVRMDSAAVRRNETLLLVGHSDGRLSSHLVSQHLEREPVPGGAELARIARVEQQQVFTPEAFFPKSPGPSTPNGNGDEESGTDESASIVETIPPGQLAAAALIPRGRGREGEKLVLTADSRGVVRVFHSNGTQADAVAVGQPVVAMRVAGDIILLLTAQGPTITAVRGARLRLVSPPPAAACEDLNGSALTAAAWDVGSAVRAHALTHDGDLLMLSVQSSGLMAQCRVTHRRPLGLPPHSPGALAPLRGYLLLGLPGGVAAFNTTAAHRSGPRDVLVESVASLAGMLGLEVGSSSAVPQIAAGGRHQVVAVGLGGGLVAVFESRLPLRDPFSIQPTAWARPLFLIVMLLAGAWQFMRAKARMPQTDHDVRLPPHLTTDELERRFGLTAGGLSSTRRPPPPRMAAAGAGSTFGGGRRGEISW